MRLKTLTAPTMPDALRLMKRELGPDAVILSTKKIRGTDGSPTLEITVAIDDEATPPPQTPAKVALTPPPQPAMPHTNTQQAAPTSANMGNLGQTLAAHHLPPGTRHDWLDAIEKITSAGFDTTSAFAMMLGKKITLLPAAQQLPPGHIHVVIGPHGAGKTTFLCKLALQRQKSGANIGLLSFDDEKLGGFAPLESVARILGDQAYLITNEKDFQTAAKAIGKRHYLFIDTPGLNPHQPDVLETFRQKLGRFNLPLQVHLVVPASLNSADMNALPYAMRDFQPQSVIFTGLDTTRRYGPIASLLHDTQLPGGLMTNSPDPLIAPQNITADILAAQLATAPKPLWEEAT